MAQRGGAVRMLSAIPNLDSLFNARVRQSVGAALAEERASVVFDAPPAGAWTVQLDRGKVRLQRGRARRPAATVTADPATMAAVLDGRMSGVGAFLDHGLTVRGNLALALQMDGAIDVGERPVTHPEAKVRTVLGVRSAYLEAGPPDAPTVVLLHGLGATNASMLPLLADLATDHHVIAPDFPGFGASSAPRWRYRAIDLASWLKAFLRDLGIDEVGLVGNSMGGRVALELGLIEPKLVNRMVLLCPSPAFRRLRQFVPLVRMFPPEMAMIPFPMLHIGLTLGIRSILADDERLPDQWYDAAADESIRIMRSARHRRAFLAAARQIYLEPAYGEDGFWDRLPMLQPSALFVWGDRDWLVPASFERHVVQAVPHSASIVLEGCGHVPQFEYPEHTAELVRSYLDDGEVAEHLGE